VAGDLASAMAKMAKLHDVAILVINQVATSLKGVRRAILKPSLSGHGWDADVHNRVVLFRDFAPRDSNADLTAEEERGLRFAEVLKVAGKVKTSTPGDVVAFVIGDAGLKEIRMTCSPGALPPPITEEERRQKRKADEIADSEDEDVELGSDDDLGLPDDDFLAELNEELPA